MDTNSSSKIGFISFPSHFASHTFALISNKRWNVSERFLFPPRYPLIIMFYKKSVEDLATGLFACISIDSLRSSHPSSLPIILFDSNILMFYLEGALSPFTWANTTPIHGRKTTFKYQLNVLSGADKNVSRIWEDAIIKFLRVWNVPNNRRFHGYDLRYKNIFCKIKIVKEEINYD